MLFVEDLLVFILGFIKLYLYMIFLDVLGELFF